MADHDFKRERRDLYAPAACDFTLVDVPAMTFFAVDGAGNPNTAPAYREAVEALYAASYAARFQSKHDGRAYVVGPLEGLWSADDPAAFVRRDKESWRWTTLIRQPDWLAPDQLEAAIEAARIRQARPRLDAIRILTLAEGPSLQILHRGAYDDEGPTLARLHDVEMPARGMTFNGPHHEIYLSDPRRVAPETLKTILRQPIRPLAGSEPHAM